MLYGSYKYGRAAYSTADLEESVVPITMTSSVTADGQRVRESGAIVMGDSATFTISFKTVNASATSSSSSSTACVGERDRTSGATVTSSSSLVGASQRVRESSGLVTPSSDISANAIVIYTSGADLVSSVASITATCNRVKHFSGSTSVTSSTSAIGREKWEVTAEGSESWSEIAEGSESWTNITESSDSWTEIAA